jgi:transposase
MKHYSEAAEERMMKVQEVILRAMAGKIRWWQAAEIVGVSQRTMRRWRWRYQQHGYDGLYDRRKGKPSPKRVPLETVEQVLGLYQHEYADHNVRHFHQKLVQEHGIELSWLGQSGFTGAGLVRKPNSKAHRQRRPRRPLPGMMLHIDASRHQWFQDERWYELLTVLDDATSQIYYAQLVEEESTRTVMAGLREVIEGHGLCCSLYSDRASHFWVTSRAGDGVDSERLTQVGRALKQLGIRLIPAYSPQARGRMERNYRTWQGRLPQELRRAQIQTLTGANQFLRRGYIAEFNRQFAVPASQPGTAFVPCRRRDLDWVFSLQHERTVKQDNTVLLERRVFQIQKTRWRHSLAGCVVTVHEHLDGRVSIRYGPHLIGLWPADQLPWQAPKPTRPARLPPRRPGPGLRIGQPVHLYGLAVDSDRGRGCSMFLQNRTVHLLSKADIFIC